MKQEEIWINHVKSLSVDDVLEEYNHPAAFQIQLKEIINSYANQYSKIIEVGCETGVTSLLLNDTFKKTFLDLNPIAISLAEKAAKNLNKKGQFVVADMFQMPFPEESFDIVFNAGVLEHFNFNDRKKALKEYQRILKQGGIMIIAFPNHYCTPYRFSYLVRILFKKWPYPLEYKLYNLKKELLDCNLRLEKRFTVSKETIYKWVEFIKPLQIVFKLLDRFIDYEGYLTVLLVRK